MLKIHLLYEHDISGNPHGCSHIRVLRPFSHPTIAGQFDVSSGTALPEQPVDIVVVERFWRQDISIAMAEELVTAIRRRAATFIYTLDDNLVDLNAERPWESSPTDQQRMVVRYFLREADGVIVSTANLKKRFCSLNKNIHVIQNALDERLFKRKPEKRNDQKLVVGYMGTFTHLADLMMILAPLRQVLQRYKDCIEFQLVGISNDIRIISCFKSLPLQLVDVRAHGEYASFVNWASENLNWDLGIAPLEDVNFNTYKSDIKFLDYSMLGIPTVCSNVDAYKNTVQHLQTGWVCDNDDNCWVTALEMLVKDGSLRLKLANNAYNYVRSNRTLAQRAVDWQNVVMQIANR